MTKAPGSASRQADVAREAGVSQATVSVVLTGAGDAGRISAETQRRVLKAARKLRYVAAPYQRTATASRSGPLLLGVHTFEPIFPTSTGDYFFEFLRGIEEQAAIEGCNLVMFTATRTDDGVRRIYDGPTNRLAQATGSLLLGTHTSHDDLAMLAGEGYPFVYVGHRDVPGTEISYVGGDYRTATGRIVDDLVALGHRTFAYVGAAGREEPQVDRWEGFSTALQRFGLDVPAPLFERPDALSTQWLDNVIERGTTAILVESAGLLHVLSAMAGIRGLAIPEDLSVVVLVDGSDVDSQKWATMRVPRNAMGRRAVRLLTALVNDPTGDFDRQILMPCSHTLATTVAAPRAASASAGE